MKNRRECFCVALLLLLGTSLTPLMGKDISSTDVRPPQTGTPSGGSVANPGAVVPIATSRFQAGLPRDKVANRWRLALNNTCRYILTDWWMNSECRGREGQYIDFGYLENNKKTGEFGKETKGGIRGPSQNAYTVAVALATNAYDTSITQVSREEALAKAVTIVKSLAKDHKVNGGIEHPWGDQWQSAQWAGKCAIAGWLLWERLEPADREDVRKMLEYEANRFLNEKPPAANEDYKNDTKGEEDAWNATGLQAACALMPNHPNAPAWREKAIEYRMTALATPKDMENEKVVDGRPVKSWISGYNLDNLGALGNHRAYPHPDYMASPLRHTCEGTIYLALAGRPIPEANRHNCNLIYGNFVDHVWNDASPIYKTDGTIYWPIAKEKDRSFRYLIYALADAGAGFLGYDDLATVKAKVWEEKHTERAVESKQRSYAAADAYLLHYLAHQGVRFAQP